MQQLKYRRIAVVTSILEKQAFLFFVSLFFKIFIYQVILFITYSDNYVYRKVKSNLIKISVQKKKTMINLIAKNKLPHFLLFILIIIIPLISSGRILLLVDNLYIKETHSIFIKSLEGFF